VFAEQKLSMIQEELLKKLNLKKGMRFVEITYQMMEKFQLISDSSKYLLAVSGGPDSMALLLVFYALRKERKVKSFRVISIDHSLREESAQELSLVEAVCKKLDVPFIGEVCKLDSPLSNIESQGRRLRYGLFEKHLRPGEYAVLGHHLNDSYEWMMMQKFKSSDLKKTLGIPIFRRPYIRPFLGFSRGQIMNFLQWLKAPYCTDASNSEINFERNYLRAKVIPQIEAKYPQYLKNYVMQSNSLAKMLGKYRGISQSKVVSIHRPFAHYLLNEEFKPEFEFAEELLRESIVFFSQGQRGKLRAQIKTVLEKKRDQGVWSEGPLHLSGGVRVLFGASDLIVYSKCLEEELLKEDLVLCETMNQELAAQIPEVSLTQIGHEFQAACQDQTRTWPLWSIVEVGLLKFLGLQGRKKEHPLYPNITSANLPEGYLLIESTKLLSKWKYQQQKSEKLWRILLLTGRL
jgi:tRNA(Ile)-lysidine synthase